MSDALESQRTPQRKAGRDENEGNLEPVLTLSDDGIGYIGMGAPLAEMFSRVFSSIAEAARLIEKPTRKSASAAKRSPGQRLYDELVRKLLKLSDKEQKKFGSSAEFVGAIWSEWFFGLGFFRYGRAKE